MTMFESGYYPAGAEHDPNAPWNEREPEPVSQKVEYSCVMRRTAEVETTDYVPGSVEKEWNGEGFIAVRDDDDFTDTDWLAEYNHAYRTPKELIDLLKETAKELAAGKMPDKPKSFWNDVVADCENWTIEDEDADML